MAVEAPEIIDWGLMHEGPVVVLDVEGGDNLPEFGISPAHLVEGARAAKENGANVVVVGLEETVSESGLPFVIAPEVVTMGTDNKLSDIRNPLTSVNIAARLVRGGDATGFASACDTAAMIGAAVSRLGRFGTINTPLVAEIPRNLKIGGTSILLDAGAFSENVSAIELARYAVMGAVFAKFLGTELPKVAFLSNGSELTKGTHIVRDAYALLAKFTGQFVQLPNFAEGRDIFTDLADVYVTDGYTGNLVLKTAEGAAGATLSSLPTIMRQRGRSEMFIDEAKDSLYALHGVFDPNRVGGAPILGVKGNALVMHGNSNSLAAEQAVLRLASMAGSGLTDTLASEIAKFKQLLQF